MPTIGEVYRFVPDGSRQQSMTRERPGPTNMPATESAPPRFLFTARQSTSRADAFIARLASTETERTIVTNGLEPADAFA
jgi:hypothetical protein